MRIYVDTSVFGGYFDAEFEIPTRRLFAMFERSEASLVLSALTIDELVNAPSRVRTLPDTLPPQHIERVGPFAEAPPLAKLYMQEGAMRPSMYVDALHIATAVTERVDVLVSWNFATSSMFARFAATTRSICDSDILQSTYGSQAR